MVPCGFEDKRGHCMGDKKLDLSSILEENRRRLINDKKEDNLMTDWRSRKRQARVTLVEVHNAINQLRLQGIYNPSLRAIHGVIGRGSLDKISALKKQLDDNSLLIKDKTKDIFDDINDIPKSSLEDAIKDNLKDVYKRLDDIEGQLSLNLDSNADLELNTALSELRQMWLDAVELRSLSLDALDDLHQLWLGAVEQSALFQEKLSEARELWLNAVDLWIGKIELAKSLQAENTDLESKLEAVQNEAQKNIDQLTQKLSEAKQENERLAGEYNKLHEKYVVLKTDVDDGSAPAKSTKRDPLTLDSEASRVEGEVIIDTDKAKARVVELAEQGLNASEIGQRLYNEGYRTKGRFDGKVKPYVQNNINKWLAKWKKTGLL